MKSKNTAIVALAVIIASVLFVVVHFAGAPGPESGQLTPPPYGAALPESGNQSQPPTPTGRAGGHILGAAGTITMIVPAAGETWLFGKEHAMRWSGEGGYPGEIMLLDAASKKTVGWITPNIASHQTNFTWDTQAVALGQKNALKKDIVPGTYIFRITFNGPRPPIESVPITVIPSGDERIITHEVSLKSLLFSPNFITVPQGDRVIVVNEDTVTHLLRVNGVSAATLEKGSAYVFDTANRAAGSYELRTKEQVIPKLTIVVK